jgi:DNA-binding HxlR family transcriptional regulator
MDSRTEIVKVACLPESQRCRRLVGKTLELIANKWAVPIVLTLVAVSPLRNSDLKRSVVGINPKELAKQLRLLEAAGVIGRKVHPTIPLRVEYWLTDLGRSLHPILEGLADWASLHGERVEANRKQYETAMAMDAMEHSRIHRIR